MFLYSYRGQWVSDHCRFLCSLVEGTSPVSHAGLADSLLSPCDWGRFLEPLRTICFYCDFHSSCVHCPRSPFLRLNSHTSRKTCASFLNILWCLCSNCLEQIEQNFSSPQKKSSILIHKLEFSDVREKVWGIFMSPTVSRTGDRIQDGGSNSSLWEGVLFRQTQWSAWNAGNAACSLCVSLSAFRSCT